MDYRGNLSSQPTFFHENNFEPQLNQGFSMGSSSSRGVLQEIPNFDNFPLVNGMLYPNSNFGISAEQHVNPFESYSSIGNPMRSNGKTFVEGGGNINNGSFMVENIQNRGLYNDFPYVTPSAEIPMMNQNQIINPFPPSFENQNQYFQNKIDFVIPDKYSCMGNNNNNNGIIFRESPVNKRIPSVKRIKGQWTLKEDSVLIHLVGKYGEKKWSHIASELGGRIGKQCRERWHNHLKPNIKKDKWTEDEDRILVQSHIKIGNKWSEIAKQLPGRTENSIKNRWNATTRRQTSRGKFSITARPPPSPLLRSYIKSLESKSNGRANQRKMNTMVPSNIPIGNTNMKAPIHQLANSNMEFDPNSINDRFVPNHNFSDMSEYGLDSRAYPDQGYNSTSSMFNDIGGSSSFNYNGQGSFDNQMEMMMMMPEELGPSMAVKSDESRKDIDLLEMIQMLG